MRRDDEKRAGNESKTVASEREMDGVIRREKALCWCGGVLCRLSLLELGTRRVRGISVERESEQCKRG